MKGPDKTSAAAAAAAAAAPTAPPWKTEAAQRHWEFFDIRNLAGRAQFKTTAEAPNTQTLTPPWREPRTAQWRQDDFWGQKQESPKRTRQLGGSTKSGGYAPGQFAEFDETLPNYFSSLDVQLSALAWHWYGIVSYFICRVFGVLEAEGLNRDDWKVGGG
ncbi:hypothetical protein AK812_SmicGene17821 [Symbiodinium microadriaticum]|uniref:Uncharacterized protein n=1 Tax=Symbiodinium microadriaticum TaxID=2951 RepID=A0A1Q9DWN4_SYMMI|nr:hypothetical protein AK812_SmicGene17821 [Symbiodinium microadriaticum]